VYLIKLIKSNQVIIIMLYVYMYVVYFVMYDSVLILLLNYGHMIGLMKYSYSYSILILVEWVP
jgi:hypothetical protein